MNSKQDRDCARSWTLQHKSWFVPVMFAGLYNQFPLFISIAKDMEKGADSPPPIGIEFKLVLTTGILCGKNFTKYNSAPLF